MLLNVFASKTLAMIFFENNNAIILNYWIKPQQMMVKTYLAVLFCVFLKLRALFCFSTATVARCFTIIYILQQMILLLKIHEDGIMQESGSSKNDFRNRFTEKRYEYSLYIHIIRLSGHPKASHFPKWAVLVGNG